MKDVPSNCLVSGNPARVIEKGIQTGPLGIINRMVQADFRYGFIRCIARERHREAHRRMDLTGARVR